MVHFGLSDSSSLAGGGILGGEICSRAYSLPASSVYAKYAYKVYPDKNAHSILFNSYASCVLQQTSCLLLHSVLHLISIVLGHSNLDIS
jgi:hypothetical protein